MARETTEQRPASTGRPRHSAPLRALRSAQGLPAASGASLGAGRECITPEQAKILFTATNKAGSRVMTQG